MTTPWYVVKQSVNGDHIQYVTPGVNVAGQTMG